MNKMKRALFILLAIVVVASIFIFAKGINFGYQPESNMVSAPTSHKIENVPYYSKKNFCYGASSMMLLKYYGLNEDEVQNYKKILETEGKGGPPDALLGFQKIDLIDKVYLGYSKKYNFLFDQFYLRLMGGTRKRTFLFKDQDEAFGKLKTLISLDIPVAALIDFGNHYVVVTGYDEKFAYVNDPDPDTGGSKKLFWDDFLAQWKNYKQDVGSKIGFPGEYGMIWLQK